MYVVHALEAAPLMAKTDLMELGGIALLEANDNSSSAAVNKWLKALEFDEISPHHLRYTVKRLIRHAELTKDLLDAVQRHGDESVAETCGRELALTWLTKTLTEAFRVL